MHIKKIDDSKVDEIIKEAEKVALLPEKTPESIGVAEKKSSRRRTPIELLSVIIPLGLLALALVQSIELLNLRAQLKNGQFGAGASSSAPSGTQNLPSQQGGC